MRTVTYLCGIDFQHEMEYDCADYFSSVDLLKASKQCWRECGIVELTLDETAEVVGMRWIVEQNL